MNSPKLFENVSILFSSTFSLTKNLRSVLRVLIVVSFLFSLYIFEVGREDVSCGELSL
uniref:Uncharacterized protein n=1 Tax=Borrelia garinii subsp. bavariensis (strain ATCC BAA-2496 / DSM 23469 / PBi) TaxID=290434 RepID=A0A7I6GXP3_BORGP|nr:hypothetical protein BGP204 [Borreliella bavariensis PBi]